MRRTESRIYKVARKWAAETWPYLGPRLRSIAIRILINEGVIVRDVRGQFIIPTPSGRVQINE